MVPIIYLVKLFEMLEEAGVDIERLARSIRLDLTLFEDKESRVDYGLYTKAIAAAIKAYKAPGLGLSFGRHVSVVDHGIIGYAFISSATFGDAIRIFIKYQNTIGPLLNLRYFEEDNMAVIRAEEIMPLGGIRQFAMEEFIGNWLPVDILVPEVARIFVEVRLDYPTPQHVDMYPNNEQQKFYFEQKTNEIRFPLEILSVPFRLANEATVAVCAEQCEKILRRLEKAGNLIDRIRRLIMAEPRNIPTLEQMAKQVAVSTRTLRRRLHEQGTSYQLLRDEIRMSLAKEYLERTDMSVQEIAFLLSYTEPANFQRAFKRWTKMTPIAYRRSMFQSDGH